METAVKCIFIWCWRGLATRSKRFSFYFFLIDRIVKEQVANLLQQRLWTPKNA